VLFISLWTFACFLFERTAQKNILDILDKTGIVKGSVKVFFLYNFLPYFLAYLLIFASFISPLRDENKTIQNSGSYFQLVV